jgi:DNA-binding NarL/FixJ family response regulator
MPRPRILIADDHRTVVEGLEQLLGSRFDVVGTVGDGRLVPDAVSTLNPDVILMDVSMPSVTGLEATRRLKQRRPECRIIILTVYAEASLAVEALNSGASGYVLKGSGEELLTAIEVVLNGGAYVARDLREEIEALIRASADPARVELDAQEQEMLRLLVEGRRAPEIAAALSLTTTEVGVIKSRIMQRLNVHSTADLVRYAIEHRLIT